MQTTVPECDLYPHRRTYIEDLDGYFEGKVGIFFLFNLLFCNIHDTKYKDFTKPASFGNAKLLIPHAGALFTLLDNLQGSANKARALTKSMEMEILSGFSYEQDFTYEVFVRKTKVGENRMESQTRIELYNARNGHVVAKSSGVFVQTEHIVHAQKSQLKKDKSQVWDSLADLRVAGRHHEDSEMSFVLTIPRPPNVLEIPSWWDASVRRQQPKRSPFEGKFEIYNVEIGYKAVVRAVVFPLLTSEGPIGNAHGGCAASAAIEVLMNKLPHFDLHKYKVRFRKPVPLEQKFVVEWQQQEEEQVWNATLLNFDRQVLQEITVLGKPVLVGKL